jgi:hypothetical protein
MLAGIAASIEDTAASMPGGTPNGTFDFVAGAYDYGGTTYTAGQVTDKAIWIGVNGLAVPASQAAGASLILAPLKTFLAACQWTMVFEVEILNAANQATIFTEANAGQAIYILMEFWAEWYVDATDGAAEPFPEYFGSVSTGIHRFAATRIDNKVSLSIDGAAVVSDTTALVLPVIGFPMVDFFLGGWSDHTNAAIRIRSMKVYNPLDDAILPLLSA